MERTLKIAAVQMDANPSPTADRLARADRLATEAAKAGAQLIVLPELFNTGYTYSNTNHRLAEPSSGPTPAWMKETAARLNVHLAGTLMLLDHDEVYNALLLLPRTAVCGATTRTIPGAGSEATFGMEIASPSPRRTWGV